jgi:nitrogen fixation NifU-like protein
MELFLNPVNVGEIVKPSARVEVEDPVCKNVIKLYLQVENNIIEEAKFKAFGCPVTIAACSLATQIITGVQIEDALELRFEQILVELVSVPEEKIVCVQAVVNAVREAIDYYYKKQEKNQKSKIKKENTKK